MPRQKSVTAREAQLLDMLLKVFPSWELFAKHADEPEYRSECAEMERALMQAGWINRRRARWLRP